MPQTKTKRKSSPHIDPVTAEVLRRRELEQYQAQLAALNEKVAKALARGTGEISPIVLSLTDRIHVYLKDHSADLRALAKALDANAEEVEGALHDLQKEGRIANVGLVSVPMWSAIVGDGVTTQELNTIVLRLISERPMTVKELTAATGARLSRVGGAVVHAQRVAAVIDVEPAQRAGRYYIVPPNARDARLAAKAEADEVGGD